MICDAHIHVGYFNRKNHDGPFYYSPRRVCSVLRRCGVDEFIFSSTSMQTKGIVFADVHGEAREVVKIWGHKAHPFLWVTNDYLLYDPSLSVLDEGLYEGLKLHGRETPWLTKKMARKLESVLEIAEERRLPVVVHTGVDTESHPQKWVKWAMRHSAVRFDFAHGSPFEEVAPCLSTARNVYVDVSCVDDVNIDRLIRSVYSKRVLWGTDFPALSAKAGGSLTQDMREACGRYDRWASQVDFARNFHRFIGMPEGEEQKEMRNG